MPADALSLRERLRAGELSCSDVAHDFLDAVAGDALHAWAAIDAERLLAQAAALDRSGAAASDALPLFGVPVGVKDNFDTVDLPTEYGSPIYAGHRPSSDAETVQRLRRAGALIAGKTKCTEFAWMHAPDTRNPLAPERTPGGSSSGSAVAVAAGQVRLTTGTQTAGSINRPASYCAVIGFKPTFDRLPIAGVKPLASSLDTVGLLGASIADVRLAFAALTGTPLGVEAGRSRRLAFLPTPMWGQVEPAAQSAIASVTEHLERIEAPPGFEELLAAQTTIQSYEAARALQSERARSPELLSDSLRAALDDGERTSEEAYRAAKQTAADRGPLLAERLREYDGVLTPSAPGVPPVGRDFTGDPLFCRVWTLIGAPSISLPLAWTADRLPVGLQLVGAPGEDRRTLAAAQFALDAAA